MKAGESSHHCANPVLMLFETKVIFRTLVFHRNCYRLELGWQGRYQTKILPELELELELE